MVLALIANGTMAGSALADKMELGFSDVGNGIVRLVAPAGEVKTACEAFEKIYGAEVGYRGCTTGVSTSMTLLFSGRTYINSTWNKMLARADVGTENGVAYFYYNQKTYRNNYAYFGTMWLDEQRNPRATYGVQGGQSQFIVGYMVSMHKACSIAASGIRRASATTNLIPTSHQRTTRNGSAMQYHFSVNGGQGADILGITVTIATGRRLGYNRCEVDIYADYGDEPPVVTE